VVPTGLGFFLPPLPFLTTLVDLSFWLCSWSFFTITGWNCQKEKEQQKQMHVIKKK
jgi:hypothetical protein